MYLHLRWASGRTANSDHRISPPPIFCCRSQKRIVSIYQCACGRCIPFQATFPFRTLVRSSLRTSTSFHLQFLHPPQHPLSRRNTLSIPKVPFHEYSHCSFLSLSSGIFFLPATSFPHKKNHRISPPPISCAGNKTLVFIVSVCFRSMHSIPSPFRSGFSYLKTCTPFCFHYIHSPQHRTRSSKTLSFRRLHLFRFTPSLIQPFQRYVSFPAAYSPQNKILD